MTDVTGLIGHGMVSRTAGLFGCEEVGTIFTFARTTPFAIARVMIDVVVIVPPITVVAEIRIRHEPVEGIASIVVVIFFNDIYDLGGPLRGCSDENDLIRGSARDHFDLMVR